MREMNKEWMERKMLMKQFGFNINLRSSSSQIREMGRALLGGGEFQALEATYHENMEGIDTRAYNDAIRDIVADYSPRVYIHFPDFNLAEENRGIRRAIMEEFIHCCSYTKNLGGKEIIVHTGQKLAIHVPIFHQDGSRHKREEIVGKTWKLSVSMMKQICDEAARNNIVVYAENLAQNMLTNSCKDLNAYLEEVGRSNLKIVFDVGHSNFNGYCPEQDVKEAGRNLAHLHLHDNHKTKDEHLTPGEGYVCWEKFLAALEEMGYGGVYMMELYQCNCENFRKGKSCLLKSMKGC